jgi:hypothetical protein
MLGRACICPNSAPIGCANSCCDPNPPKCEKCIGGICQHDCTGSQVPNPSNCQCEYQGGFEVCNGTCVPKCPPGQVHDPATCSCALPGCPPAVEIDAYNLQCSIGGSCYKAFQDRRVLTPSNPSWSGGGAGLVVAYDLTSSGGVCYLTMSASQTTGEGFYESHSVVSIVNSGQFESTDTVSSTCSVQPNGSPAVTGTDICRAENDRGYGFDTLVQPGSIHLNADSYPTGPGGIATASASFELIPREPS